MTIARPLAYIPPSYFALAQQGTAAPQLSGDFLVKKGSLVVLTSIDQTNILGSSNTIRFASQSGVEYVVDTVSATFIKLTTAYTGLEAAEIAPAAEASRPAQSVSDSTDANRVVTSATLVSPSQATPPSDAQLTTLLAEFTMPQETAPALTYEGVSGGPFTVGEIVEGEKSGGRGVVLYDDPGVNNTGTLAFVRHSVKSGFVRGEPIIGLTSHAVAVAVVPRTQATNPLPIKLSGLYARTLSLVLGAPVVSQPITVL